MNLSNDSKNSAYDGAGRLNHTIWRSRAFNRLPIELRLTYIYLIAGPAFSPSGIFAVDPSSVGAAVYPADSAADATRTGKRLMGEFASWRGVGIRLLRYDEPTCWVDSVREFYLQSDIPGIQDQIDRDVAKVLPGPVLDAYKAKYGLGDSGLREYSEMSKALATVTVRSMTMWGDRQEKASQELMGEYTPEQILTLYSKGGWWYTDHWQGQKGQFPTLTAIQATIGPALAGQTTETKHSLKSFEPLIATVDRLTSRGASAKAAKQAITQQYGVDAWKKLTTKKRWANWLQVKEGRVQWEVFEAMK